MKRRLLTLLTISLVQFIFAQERTAPLPKLSAGALQYLWKLEHQPTESPFVFPGYVYRTNAQNQLFISAIVKVENGFSTDALTQLGVSINTKAGNIWTTQVPVDRVSEFMEIRGVEYIEMDQPIVPLMDSARVAAHVDSVHSGLGLPQPYTGKNVVVGIIDGGFDYTHPSLYDTLYNTYRVKRVWEEKTSGTPPAGFTYGAEYADSAAIHSKGFDNHTSSHGSHVAGIASGSGYGGDTSNRAFRGMAYNSDLVLVAIAPSLAYWQNTGMADMLDGANYIFQYAQSVGKPAVANLSWGGPIGPRDGLSLFSQALDNITGPGKIFCVSAGNNGTNRVHLQKTFTPTDTSVSTIVVFNSFLPQKTNLIDIWGDSNQVFCVKFSLFIAGSKTDSTISFCLDNSTHSILLKGANGDTCFVTLTAVASEFNGKPHMLLDVYNKANDRFCLTVTGHSGTVNMWQGYVLKSSGYYGSFSKLSYPFASNGDSIMQISDLVSSRSAIGVAAYTTKTSYVNVSGQFVNNGGTKGDVASFSSHGPASDGRTKPDIAGPGMVLGSAVSAADSAMLQGGEDYGYIVSKFVSPKNAQTYAYAMFQGTSMSSPAVSGVVALLLEINPNLTPDAVKAILAQTAITDNFTGTITQQGSTTWGFGKVNAYAAVKKTLETSGIFHIPSALTCLLYPNPGQGIYEIQLSAEQSEQAVIKVYNTEGVEMVNEVWPIQNGLNKRSFDLQPFPTGMYVARVSASGKVAVIKILKY